MAYFRQDFFSDLPQHLGLGAGTFLLSTVVFWDITSSPPRDTPEARPAGQGEATRKINAMCE